MWKPGSQSDIFVYRREFFEYYIFFPYSYFTHFIPLWLGTFLSSYVFFFQSEPIYTSANIINNTEGLEFITMDEMRDMHVTIGDFSQNSSSIPTSDQHESDRPPNSPILVTITAQQEANIEMFESKEYHYVENVNIQSDEKMPPRGELSGRVSSNWLNPLLVMFAFCARTREHGKHKRHGMGPPLPLPGTRQCGEF